MPFSILASQPISSKKYGFFGVDTAMDKADNMMEMAKKGMDASQLEDPACLEDFWKSLSRCGTFSVADILDIIASGILVLSRDETILFANTRAVHLLDIPQSVLKGSHVSSIFMPEDRQVLARNLLSLIREQGAYQMDLMLKRGRLSNFLALFAGYWWDERELFVISINDITRVKGIEEVLNSSERMLHIGRMLDDISHQIRNPVLAIGGFARRLAKTEVERPDYVQVIMEESRRLETLLDVLSSYIQLPRPKFSFMEVAQIEAAFKRWIQRVEKGFDHEIAFELTSTGKEASVIADLWLLEQALVPVVINAVEAYETKEGMARIRIRVEGSEEAGGGCTIEIEDFGEGIRPTLVNRVFHPFFTTKTGHIGMGLTFTKRIIDDLDGSVEICSSLGSGSRVSISLPGERRRQIRRHLL